MIVIVGTFNVDPADRDKFAEAAKAVMTETVIIDWEPGDHPVSGSLTAGHAPPRRFTGWLELLSLLQGTHAAGADETTRTPEEGP